MWEQIKNIIKYKEINQTYLIGAAVTGIIALLLSIALYYFYPLNVVSGTLFFTMIVVIICSATYAIYLTLTGMNKHIEEVSVQVKNSSSQAFQQLPVCIMLFDENRVIKWINPYFQRFWKGKTVIGSLIEEVDPELYHAVFDKNSLEHSQMIEWRGSYFHAEINEEYHSLYLIDITEYGRIAKVNRDIHLVIGYLTVDNYDDVVKNSDSNQKSLIDTMLNTNFKNWANQFDLFVQKLEDDKYIIITTYDKLRVLEKDNFKILNTIRETSSMNNLQLSISLAFSHSDHADSVDPLQISGQALKNLDMALGRGGDQVVIKTKDQPAVFYGGKTNPMVKRTRTRANRTSNLLQSIITDAADVIVMGHQYPDMDSIGACLGIYRISRMNQRDCRIVIDRNQFSDDIKRVFEMIDENAEYDGIFIDKEEAAKLVTVNTALIIVDVHNPKIFAAPELINMATKAVIIDHHRKGELSPENVILEYIEPYASSASELITEFFQFQPTDQGSINKLEATVMLAGITVDTRNFSLRAGSRTFDAASFLMTRGANTVTIQKLLKEDVTKYLTRNHLLSTIEYVNQKYAIVHGENDESYSNVLASQTADTMLSLNDCEAAFVVYRRNDGRIGISARSLGTINVQTIMERMGGGGHLSNAATQISEGTTESVVEELKELIKELSEGE